MPMKQGCYAFLPSFVAPSVEFVHTVLVAVSALIAILDDVFQVRLVLFYRTMRDNRWVCLEHTHDLLEN